MTSSDPDSEAASSPSDGAAELEALADEARAHSDATGWLTDAANGRADEAVRVNTQQRQSRAPAEGERNAVVGYLGQYELAAMRTLSALREGTLVSVRVADVKAGQIDDFQLELTDRVDAHQVKWSLHPGSIGYAQFVRDADDRTRYIRQLANGWERLTALHTPRRVVVHFVTDDFPSRSTNRSIPRAPNAEQSAETARSWSFAAFLVEAWRPAVVAARAGGDPNDAVPSPWAPAMAAFATASGLHAEAWRRFIADCELEFGVPSLQASVASAPVTDAERAVLRDDTDRLAHAFMRLVARPDRRVEFTREQLLDEVGWRYRAEFRHSHEFPDPEIPYRSIRATVREARESIEQFTSGYLAVIGSPGSGKSTLLTRTLRESPHRVVRYYAYVRDAVGGSLRRGEAVNFFHDLTVALDRIGLHAGSTLPVDDLDLLTQRVHAQLAQAHSEWEAGGPRTIILVDGLDHIPREQHPTQSLLSHLPHPEDVQQGVLFVLGTQTDRLQQISRRIREQLDEPGRRITMRLLERRDVVDIVETAGDLAPAPTPAERERIFELSGGHPLALNYIINRLRHSSGAPVASTLDAVEPFSEGIDRQYATIWGADEDDVEVVHFLALLARARGAVRLEWLQRWAPRQALHAVTTRLAYLFRQGHGGRWTFFHNSFRAFLIEQTRALPALGGDTELFTELAERCAETNAPESENADELFYRARAGDTARVLALTDPEGFRAQFAAGRSATIIRDDLALALDAAVAARDIAALTQVVLCSAEFVQRESFGERLPLAETWLEFGDVDRALAALREGASLRTSREAALRAVAVLDARGISAEAREIFALAEPLDVLRGTEEPNIIESRDEADLLDAWITVAPRFRPVAEILDMIQDVHARQQNALQRRGHAHSGIDDSESKARQCFLLQGLSIALDTMGRRDDADQVRATLRARDSAADWWFWAQSRAVHAAFAAGEHLRAEARFAALCEALERGEIPESGLEPVARVNLAGAYVRVGRNVDAARRLLDGIVQPAPVTDATHRNDGWAGFSHRFALNRVLGALGDSRPLHEIVPDVSPGTDASSNLSEEGAKLLTKFERGVAQLGRLAGRTWVEGKLAPSDFELHARPLVQLFPDRPQTARGGSAAIRGRRELYETLVQVAVANGTECVAVLVRLLEDEWSKEFRREAWPESIVRTTLVALLSGGAPAEWVRRWLARVEPTTFRVDELEDNLLEGMTHARAWAAAGDIVAARTTLERVLGAAFGSGTRNTHLDACLVWAVRANSEHPAGMPDRLAKMAAAILALDGTDAQSEVATDLLRAGVAAGARPARALVEWSLRNDVHWWVRALSVLIDGLVMRTPAAAGPLSACYRSLVLPFARAADVDTVAHLSSALRRSHDVEELGALGEAIEVVALGSTRPALREAVAGRPEVALELLRDDEVIDPAALGQVVDAFEGLSLTLRELQLRVHSVTDVEDLVRRLRPNAFAHRWELILAPFLVGASADELVATAAVMPPTNDAWKALAMIGERLIALGDARAESVVERVIQRSRAAGWWAFYDGGSRLAGYELLVRVSPEDGRQGAWRALRDDIAAGEIQPIDVFRDWERIVAMLAPDTSAVPIWEMVSQHVTAVVTHAPQGDPLVLPTADAPDEPAAATAAICDLAAIYLDHPALVLAQGAQQFFTDRLLAGDVIAESSLTARLADPGTPKNGALQVLRAFVLVRGEVPASMLEAVRALRGTLSYSDRRVAIALSGDAHVSPDEGIETIEAARSPVIHVPLPAVFGFVHPPAPPPQRGRLIARGAVLEPAENAADVIDVFRAELDLIAQWAGVQAEALYRYVADRATAKLPDGSQDYSFDDEPILREELRRIGLEVTYRRPPARRVEQAMAEATAMLVDHGRLGGRYLPALDRLFRNADPYFMVARPTRRPLAVVPIPERMHSQYVGNDWTAGVTADNALTGHAISANRSLPVERQVEAPFATHRLEELHEGHEGMDAGGSLGASADEWIVLAEETWLRWLDWKLATETRIGARLEARIVAMIGAFEGGEELSLGDNDGDTAAGQALDARVANFTYLTADEYLTGARAPYSIVVRNLSNRFGTPAGRWLAINPALAEHLGWRPSADGLFRWVDANGRVMAESVWWQDGFAQQRPPHFEDEVGYGWLVRVSISGWRELVATVGGCMDWRRVARLAKDQPPQRVVDWEPAAGSFSRHDST